MSPIPFTPRCKEALEWLSSNPQVGPLLQTLAQNVTHPDDAADQCVLSHSGGAPAFIYRKTETFKDQLSGLTSNDADLGF
jgi:hypothetical protein